MTVRVHRYTPTDPRLGRHVRHDSRSAQPQYSIAPLPRSAVKSVAWPRHIPILDQGQLGSCVPNNGPEFLGTDALGYTGVTSVSIPKADSKGEFTAGAQWPLDETFAVNLYRLVTRIDSYPGQWEPDDTGSDGLTLAQALVMLGFSDVYQHAFTYDAVVAGLKTGPITLGIEWENSMFTTAPDGKIVIDYTSGVAGGHQIFAREFDADNDRVWIDNSWGEHGFGLDGRGYFQGSELAAHLKRNGDATQPHLISGATPTPTPTPTPKPVITGQQLFDKIKAVAKAGGLK